MPSLQELLLKAEQRGASDLHLVVGLPPTLRVHTRILRLGENPLTAEEVRSLLDPVVDEEGWARLQQRRQLDLAIHPQGCCRSRLALFYQDRSLSASLRLIPTSLPEAESLGLPAALANFSRLTSGLVLLTGPTGSGKSTTMSVLIDRINRHREVRIITIEDPVEFKHTSRKSVILQRQVGEDTLSFADGLVSCLRQDPDVIVVGEMRDYETISVALTAAETGHLVISTLHTSSASETIQRVVDVFPAHQQSQVRSQLAGSLQGVLCQRLLPRLDQQGMALAFEVLMATRPVRHMIREGRVDQLANAMVGGKQQGMCPMDHCLRSLLDGGQISYDIALTHCSDPDSFDRLTEVGAPALL